MVNLSSNEVIFDGELEIVTITSDLYDEVIEFQRKNFLEKENLCLIFDLINSEQAIQEALTRFKIVLENGIGFAVRHCKTKEIVATCVNKILPTSYKPAPRQAPCLKKLGESLASLDSFDVLKEWNIDCCLDIAYLSTRSDYGGRGLAIILAQHSVELAREMLNGTLVDKSLLPSCIRESKPKAVRSLFTSSFTQRVGEKLGMETVSKVSCNDLMYEEGKSFAEKIDLIHEFMTVGALRL